MHLPISFVLNSSTICNLGSFLNKFNLTLIIIKCYRDDNVHKPMYIIYNINYNILYLCTTIVYSTGLGRVRDVGTNL